jgi:hypothetical protein
MNMFFFDPVQAINGIVYAFLWGLFLGFVIGFIRFVFFGILERSKFGY